MKAFPLVTQRPDGVVVEYNSGMDLRDWFAGKALQGMLSNPNGDGYKHEYATWAYEYADEMMKAREKK